jgi:hypothetical protein
MTIRRKTLRQQERASIGEPAMFFEYGERRLPAYRDDKGLMVILPGGKERPVDDLWKFWHEASPISEDDFDALKKATIERGSPHA